MINQTNNNNPNVKKGKSFAFHFNKHTMQFVGGFDSKLNNSDLVSVADSALVSNVESANGNKNENNLLSINFNEKKINSSK
jgi:hypothetical protein